MNRGVLFAYVCVLKQSKPFILFTSIKQSVEQPSDSTCCKHSSPLSSLSKCDAGISVCLSLVCLLTQFRTDCLERSTVYSPCSVIYESLEQRSRQWSLNEWTAYHLNKLTQCLLKNYFRFRFTKRRFFTENVGTH